MLINERSVLRSFFQRGIEIPGRISVLTFVLVLHQFSPIPSHAIEPQDLDWIRLRTDGIVVFSSADEEKSRAIVESLLRFRDDCLAFLPVDPFVPPAPANIYVLGNESAYENLCNSSSAAIGTAGVFFQAVDASYIAIDLTAGSLALETVYHEYFHFIAEHTMPTLPVWANEGLAEFFSTYEFPKDHGIIGHPIKDHVDLLWSEEPMPFLNLFAVDSSSDDYHQGFEGALFYAESWAIVHGQLTGSPAEREGFLGYLAALAQGMSAQEALVESLELDEERILDQLYSRKKYLELPVLSSDQSHVESVIWQTDKPSSAEILSALGMFTARLPRTMPEAPRKFFQEAQRLEPNGFMPYLGLALVERNLQSDQSRASFAQARELAPDEPLVLDAYGEFLVEQYEKASDLDPDVPTSDLELARELFLTSLGSHPDDPRALAGYSLSFQYADEIPADVIEYLDKAIMRYPSRVDLLMAKCVFTARRGDHEEAWSLYNRDLQKMRPGRDVVQSVRNNLLNAAMVDSYNTAQSGQIEEGRLILEVALPRYGSKRANREAWEQFAEAEGNGRHNFLVDRYNEGVDAINQKDFSRALELMEEVAEAAEDPTLRESAVEAADLARTRIK